MPQRFKVDQGKIEEAARMILEAIGEDVGRPELLETPGRLARYWAEFIEFDPGQTETAFPCVNVDQMVVVRDMRIWSLCEHHLLPFYCDITIGYITHDKLLGLSKFARIAHKFSHKLQVQERLVTEIAAEITRIAGHDDVAVLAKGEHLCMTSRGIRTQGLMISSSMTGVFRNEGSARSEFFQIAGINNK